MSRVKEYLTRSVEISVWLVLALLVLLVVDMIDDENWIGLAIVGVWVVVRCAFILFARRAER